MSGGRVLWVESKYAKSFANIHFKNMKQFIYNPSKIYNIFIKTPCNNYQTITNIQPEAINNSPKFIRKSFKIHPKSIQNQRKMHPKSIQNQRKSTLRRGCIFGAALGAKREAARFSDGPFWKPFSIINLKKQAKVAQRKPKVGKRRT
jgi:hypothetical protein